ncbi:flavin reductase family protein [Epibacterium ulvae]|nr:flavin reductase family protein [Epibacterium ulvae]
MQQFEPDASNARNLRDAFGRFATGVTVVTVGSNEGPVAITANSFSSVSIDPPLVLWSPQKASRRFPYFVEAEYFAVHVLSTEQSDLCWDVAKDMSALSKLDVAQNAEGVPVLEGCLARFECSRHAIYDGGDHEIVVGRVLRVTMRDTGDALGFFKGKMSTFQAQ